MSERRSSGKEAMKTSGSVVDFSMTQWYRSCGVVSN
jgi:hypothetical protein